MTSGSPTSPAVQMIQRLIARVGPPRGSTLPPSLAPFAESIVRSIREGRLTLFVGAGAAYASGFPTWAGLLERLSQLLVVADEKDAFDQLSVYDSPLVTARYLKTRLGVQQAFHSFVHEALYSGAVDYRRANPAKNLVCSLAMVAAKLDCRLDILTYNFDDLLEVALAEELGRDSVDTVEGTAQYDSSRAVVRILHVHGFLPREFSELKILPPPPLILSEDDFHRLMNDGNAWQNQVQAAALAHRDCLFIGMSMTDPNLRRLIDFVQHQGIERGSHNRWIVARRYRQGDVLAPGAKKMSKKTADALNSIKADLFQSLGAEPFYVDGFDEIEHVSEALLKAP